MELASLLKLFLPEFLVEHFDIVRGCHDKSKERIDIWLDEKKVPPVAYYAPHEIIAYGFTPETIIQDFPIKGCAVFLHLRRRKWQEIRSGKIFSQTYDLTYQGTQLTKEFVAFLKATH